MAADRMSLAVPSMGLCFPNFGEGEVGAEDVSFKTSVNFDVFAE